MLYLFLNSPYKITTFPLTFQIIPHIFYIHPPIFCIKQIFRLQKKAGNRLKFPPLTLYPYLLFH